MDATFSDIERRRTVPPTSPIPDEDAAADNDNDNDEVQNEGSFPNFDSKPAFEAKIMQLLRNINSAELQLCVDGCKEFKKLLRGNSGGDLLCQYVNLSPKLAELLEAWNSRRGKVAMPYILSLISSILNHSDGRYDRQNHDSVRVSISRVLDKFSRLVVEERMEDLNVEINSKEGKRQKAALLLLASVVRRGSLLANEVAKKFDFKMPVVGKLAEYRKKKVEKKRKDSTRGAFVEFAMSFLEAGKPGLVKSVLQQREVFSGILRGLGNDDDETVEYILSTLRDRVLTDESGVPPPLRSVLFGSVTLEQLVDISARGEGVPAAEVAYEVLHMVCIDPSNGLMPDLKRKPAPLKGNHKRLVDLMKKLKATEVEYHRMLLLAIVNGRAALASSYLDQFPYNLEDQTSPTWLPAITLAAKVVSSVRGGIVWDFLAREDVELLSFDNADVQDVYKCVCLRPFTRLAVNKGLLHPDRLIKHGTLRLLLEVLKLLSSFADALTLNRLSALKQKIQNEVRILLPDSQVLFTLISSIGTSYQNYRSSRKRAADSDSIVGNKATGRKRQKTDANQEDMDILVAGLQSAGKSILSEEREIIEEEAMPVSYGNEIDIGALLEIWGLDESSDVVNNEVVFFHCKVLEALKIYHGTLINVTEVSYDVLKVLPSDPLELPNSLLQSLLSMLIEHFGCSTGLCLSGTTSPPIYKHMQSFLVLFLHSPIRDIRQQAYILAKAAMMSTGAFDHNSWEVGTWFLFLPGNIGSADCCTYKESKSLQSLSTPVVSFLCDAVSTVGNNLVKYWDVLKRQYSIVETGKEKNVSTSPLIICILEKCLRLLRAGSGTFTLPEKSMISLYVCNTLKYLLQTQVEAGSLAAIIHQLITERNENHNSAEAHAESGCCEWRPLISLMLFSRAIQCQETCNTCSTEIVSQEGNKSFVNTLTEVNSLLTAGAINGSEMFKAVYLTILCTAPDDILKYLPAVMAFSGEIPGFHHYVMNCFGVDQSVMKHICKLWPEMFRSGLQMSLVALSEVCKKDERQNWDRIPFKNLETEECGSIAFGSYLKEAPFYILFPGLIFCGQESRLEIKELLVAKVSTLTTEHFISSLRLVLFWFHQIQLSYRKRPSEQHEWGSEVCFILVKHILGLMSSLKVDCASSAFAAAVSGQEVAETVFGHPAVTAALSCPLKSNYELTEEIVQDCSDGLLRLSGERICKLELLCVKLLTTTCDYLVALFSREHSSSLNTECKETIAKSFKNLVQRLFLVFKNRFNLWYKCQDLTLLPILCAVVAMMRFISPMDLLELANWIFAGMELSASMVLETDNVSPVCLAFSIASAAFDMLSQYLRSSKNTVVFDTLFWSRGITSFDVSLFQSIYLKVFQAATVSKMELAGLCFHRALCAAHSLTYRQELLLSSMEVSRIIACTPTNMVSHCVCGTNQTKAKLLCLLIETSPLHSSVFGHSLSEMLRRNSVRNVHSDQAISGAVSDDEYVMLLPAAISYVDSSRTKLNEQSSRDTEIIPAFYSKLLIDGFIDWKDFVARDVFKVEYRDISPCSVEDLNDFFSKTLLSKAVSLLSLYCTPIGDNINKRSELFCSLCPSSGALGRFLDFDVGNIDSVEQLLNITNGAVAKISLCMMLLLPEDLNKCPSSKINRKGESVLGKSNEDSLRMRFLDTLVSVWQQIVKKLPYAADCDQKSPIFLLSRCLEVFTLRCICTLTLEMQNVLIQMHPVPFVVKIAKAALLHRFRDPTTLENLRRILLSLSDGDLPAVLILQLLLGHSQLSSAISNVGDTSDFVVSGIAVKPISSFLKSYITPTEMASCKSETCRSQLEVVKLLRILFNLRARQDGLLSEEDLGVNLGELVLVLLSSYRATVSEIDMEIYGVLFEVDSAEEMGQKKLAELDYLWGSALAPKKESQIGNDLLNNDMADIELERRRSHFRDCLPIDTKLLIETVIHFPYGRTVPDKTLFFDNSHHDHVKNALEGSMEIGGIKLYDPVFLLSLSIHSLSMGYLDPVEFAGLGLLAVALMSIASVEDGIRKLGYEVLGRFSDALKSSQKKREVTRLKLLMTCLQNGIEEPWQKIPTISAMFVAEASVVLLDPSHEHYLAISKFFSQFSRIDLKKIPLFRDVFGIGSVNYKTDRLWILRLLCAGINYEDDAQVFIRNAVPEILLSDYASTISDIESKELILQVVKKCVKEQTMARYLIENCCLIPWLSSVLAFYTGVTNDDNLFVSKRFIVLLEVVQEIVSSASDMEWFQKHALEQLSDLSYHLLNLLITRSKLLQKAVPSATIMLKVIVSALEISQKREMDLPHFTPSLRSLYQLYEAVDAIDCESSGRCSELGLKAILMSIPPTNFDLGLEELSKFLGWAVSTALRLDSRQAKRQTDSPILTICVEKPTQEETMSSTLLRWLVASLILQSVSCSRGDPGLSLVPRVGAKETLLSLVERFKSGGLSNLTPGHKGSLAAHIFHLQQHLGIGCRVLPSAVAALSILLLADTSGISVDVSGSASDMKSSWSKISHPPEATPAWKWSYQQPWADETEGNTASDTTDELRACQHLLVIVLEILEKKSLLDVLESSF